MRGYHNGNRHVLCQLHGAQLQFMSCAIVQLLQVQSTCDMTSGLDFLTPATTTLQEMHLLREHKVKCRRNTR
jgi:hypothetical protein